MTTAKTKGPLYVALPSDRFLIEQLVDVLPPDPLTSAAAPASGINHDVLLIDVSGSMSGVISDLFEDLIKYVYAMPENRYLSVIKFSGQGQAKTIVQNVQVRMPSISDASGPSIRETLAAVLRKEARVWGMTNISGPLRKATEDVLDVMAPFGHAFHIRLFTDGQPTEPWDRAREESDIMAALQAMKSRIQSMLLFGYGHYINSQLLSQMAGAVGGTFVRSFELGSFLQAMNEATEASKDLGGKVLVKVDRNAQLYFNLVGDSAVFYDLEEDGEHILYQPSLYTGPVGFRAIHGVEVNGQTLNKKQRLFVVSDTAPANGKLVRFSDKNWFKGNPVEHVWKAAYAYVTWLNQTTQTPAAVDLLSLMGDKALVDVLGKAITPRDHAAAEALIQGAVRNASARMLKGRHVGCAPKADCFTLWEALQLLEKDEKASWFPYLRDSEGKKVFDYRTIDIPKILKDEVPRVTPVQNAGAPFKIKLTNGRPNIGLMGFFPVIVPLDAKAADHNLPAAYRTGQWRTYNVVRDGDINVQILPCKMSVESWNTLSANGMVIGYMDGDRRVMDAVAPWQGDVVYLLDLSTVPIVNRIQAQRALDGKELCKDLFTGISRGAELKVLNFFLAQAQTIEERVDTSFGKLLTAEAKEYLKSFRIHPERGYSPSSDDYVQADATDVYEAVEIKTSVAGLSSLDDVVSVIERKDYSQKPMTPNQLLMAKALTFLETKGLKVRLEAKEVEGKGKKAGLKEVKMVPVTLTEAEKSEWRGKLEPLIKEVKGHVTTLDWIIATKFLALLLSGQWFTGETNRDLAEFTLNMGEGFELQKFSIAVNRYAQKI